MCNTTFSKYGRKIGRPLFWPSLPFWRCRIFSFANPHYRRCLITKPTLRKEWLQQQKKEMRNPMPRNKQWERTWFAKENPPDWRKWNKQIKGKLSAHTFAAAFNSHPSSPITPRGWRLPANFLRGMLSASWRSEREKLSTVPLFVKKHPSGRPPIGESVSNITNTSFVPATKSVQPSMNTIPPLSSNWWHRLINPVHIVRRYVPSSSTTRELCESPILFASSTAFPNLSYSSSQDDPNTSPCHLRYML